MSALLVANANGANAVAILDIVADKLRRVPDFGGRPILLTKADPPQMVSDKVQEVIGTKPDVVVDAVGSEESFSWCLATVAKGGTILLIGNLSKEVTLPLQTTVSNETTLIGTYGFDKSAFEEALQMVPNRVQPLATLIEGRCSLEETPEVITRLAKGEQQALKVVIEF